MKKLLQEYIKLQISKILSEGFYENPMTTIQDVLDSFGGRTLIFFDTETTGLTGTKSFSQITEIAAVAFNDQANQLGQYHYKTKLNPGVLTRIEQEKKKKSKQQIIDSKQEKIQPYKDDLLKLKDELNFLIKANIVSPKDQYSLYKSITKLSVKILELIKKSLIKTVITREKIEVKIDPKKEIEKLILDYEGIKRFITSKKNVPPEKQEEFYVPPEKQEEFYVPPEKQEEFYIEIKTLLNKIKEFIKEVKPEKNEWDWKWKSIEDILDMTQYHESNAEVISEKEALQGFKQFIDSFPNPLLIAHNATFDMMQINNGMKRYNLGYIPKDMQVLDTVKLVENYIKPLLRILKGGNPTEKTKRLIVALSFQGKVQGKNIKEMDIQQYKEFIDEQNIEEIYKNVTKLFGSLKHLTVGLNVELKNWHSAVADAEALSKVLLNLSQIMFKYKHFEQQFEMQRKRSGELGYQRQRQIEREIERAKKKKQS